MDAAPLLRRFLDHRDEDAFRRLVDAHIDLVYSAALRQIRDHALADDITQTVFITLARNANRITPGVPLEAWLLKTTHYAACDARRRRDRRLHHERKAHLMNPPSSPASPDDDPDPIAKHLDDALMQLRDTDRTILILRFMRSMSLKEVGAATGLAENTAGKRIARALEKLRDAFARKNVALPAAAIPAALAAATLNRAPEALAATVSQAALNASLLSPLGIGGHLIMTATRTKLAIAATLLLLIAGLTTLFFMRSAKPVAADAPAANAVTAAPAAAPASSAAAPAPASQPPDFIREPLPAATYAADPAHNLFPAGMIMDLDPQRRPRGWDDLAALAGHGYVGDEWLHLTNDDPAKSVEVHARIPLHHEYTQLAVMTRLWGERKEVGPADDSHYGVSFTFLDKDNRSTGVGALFEPHPVGNYTYFRVRTTTLAVPEDAATLLITVGLSHVAGLVEAGKIVVTPIDSSKEADPEKVVVLQRAIKSNNAATVEAMITADRRLLEARGLEYNAGTPLLVAESTNRPEIIKLLLQLGADTGARDRDAPTRETRTAADWACTRGHAACLEAILPFTHETPEEFAYWINFGLRHNSSIPPQYQTCIDLLHLPSTAITPGVFPRHMPTTAPTTTP